MLIGYCLFLAACGSLPLPANVTLEPTSLQRPEKLDRLDFPSVASWVAYSLEAKHPEMLADLIGPNGVLFAKYGTEPLMVGFQSANDIISSLAETLEVTSPHCLGYIQYIGTSNKAAIFISGIGAAVSKRRFSAPGHENVVVFDFAKSEHGWELALISPLPEEFAKELLKAQDDTTACFR